jgi:hypothetical protein
MPANISHRSGEVGSQVTMDESTFQNELKTAVTRFETCLLTPIVSGELAAWTEDLDSSWGDASAQIHFLLKHHHPRQYEEIGNQDPELLPRIELLKAEDEAIEQQRELFTQSLNRVAQHAPKLEPDEEKAQKHTKSLIEDGVAFLARLRKQQIAVQTWYVEAFNRDRGAVD